MVGGRALLWFTRRVPLPSEDLLRCERWLACCCCSVSPFSRAGRGSWPYSPPGSWWAMDASVQAGGRTVPFSAGQPRRDRRLRRPWSDHRPQRDRSGRCVIPGLILLGGARIRHPARSGRVVPRSRPAREQHSATPCCSLGLKGAVPHPAGCASCSPPTWPNVTSIRHRRGRSGALRRGARQPDTRRRQAATYSNARVEPEPWALETTAGRAQRRAPAYDQIRLTRRWPHH